MIWSLHIPKTAGITFRGVLQSVFGKQMICAYGRGHPFDTDYASGYVFDRTVSREDFGRRCVDNSVRCVHGHFEARRVVGTFADERFAVWIRDPIERLLSEYAHHRRERDSENHFSVLIHEGRMSIEEFADAEQNRNVQTKYLSGLTPSQLAFVGVTEEFDREIEAFCTAFDLDLRLACLAAYTRLNVNPHRVAARYDVDPRLREYLLECNADDHLMYQHYVTRRARR